MIWRRLLMPRGLTLYGLHRTIQIAFGWEDYHLHAFKLHGRRFGTEWTGQRHHVVEDDGTSLREVTLADLSLRLRQKIIYEYDFGDFWEHEIRVEAREEAKPGTSYPVCIGGARAGPPEDIGGPDGYDRLLRRLDEVRLDRLYGVVLPPHENDALGTVSEDSEVDPIEDAWSYFTSHGFDGDDDPLLRYDPAAFDRAAVNAELRQEFVVTLNTSHQVLAEGDQAELPERIGHHEPA
jgi:hypothetical protein